jgi:4-hydroxybenzoate polyprenyltransferase
LQSPAYFWLKKVIDGFLYNNLYIGLCAAALSFSGKTILNLKSGSYVEVFIFLSTVTVYSLQRTLPKFLNFHGSKDQRIYGTAVGEFLLPAFTLSSSLLVFIVFFENKSVLFPWLLLLFMLCLWYSSEIKFQKLYLKNLRRFPYLKMVLIACTWVSAVVFIPAAEAGKGIFNHEAVFSATELLFFLLAVILPFDIRDMDADRAAGIKTIPLKFGEWKSKVLSGFFLGASGIISLSRTIYYPQTSQAGVAFFVVCVFTGFVIIAANKNRSAYFFSGLLESMILLRGIAVIFMEIEAVS